MMLKNWTVTTQAVKGGARGIINRERYFLSAAHPNHQNTERLISLIGNKETTARIAASGERYKLYQQLNQKKGGRPLSSYAMEYCLTLPKGYRPSPKQWQLIIIDCCKAISELLALDKCEMELFQKQIRAVLHQQFQKKGSGAGDHVHLVIGKVLDYRVLRELQQRKVTKVLKHAFNCAVLNHFGVSHTDYKPYELSRGKRLSTVKYQYRKASETLKSQKLISKLQEQADKWLLSLESGDLKQQRRQRNRIASTVLELGGYELDAEQSIQYERIKSKVNL
ncbi:hypothetical protein LZI70_03840 [Vibrio pelagius]|uniref:Phage protein n=1 Tax=Vibrio pelagius TaxID=28169 RepID=A0ABY5G6D5_VIBPE|nr:hypothetical protein [Vibrio pelagius]UTT85422.1 hypothetical protein LZI70_03840 [Vibrio pelagius]